MAQPSFIIAQINSKVGDINGNVARIIQAATAYRNHSNALVIFPELSIIGYPPEDLVLRPSFVHDAMAAIHQLASLTNSDLPAMIVGGIYEKDGLVFNAAFVLSDGVIQHIHCKSMLPNYGVFDEKRLFARGSSPIAFEIFGARIGLLVCEDAWFEHNFRLLKAQAAEHVIVINASPFEMNKQQTRLDILADMARKYQQHIIYCNLVGGQDDIIFDGNSFVIAPSGEVAFQAPAFAERVGAVDSKIIAPTLTKYESIWRALTLGLKDYVFKNGFKNVLLGLSGGIDSAVVAALAADALGAANVLAVMLPSEFTSKASHDDAVACAHALNIRAVNLPIIPCVSAMEHDLIPALGALGVNIADWQKNLNIGGNIQSRLRGLHLMSISNATGSLLLNTSNKSELAVGYSTLYGDSCGAYAPIKDVYKTEIYALAHWRNSVSDVIPANIIHKAPSAELAPNQKDSDQLPEYPMLDAILYQLIEEKKSIQDVSQSSFDETVVTRIYHLLKNSEYKRRQSPLGTKITSMHFNRDWRYPLTNGYTN